MTTKQIEFAQTIRAAGRDLMTLINDILDLSKIESGTTAIDLQDVSIDSLEAEVRRTFAQIAADKQLSFTVMHDEDVPLSIVTDPTRLQQVLKNLLSNAFKFTSEGSVALRIHMAYDRQLTVAGPAIAFEVSDTGIGIAPDKYNVIFEAFQQADMGTSRKFGGTGLGLAISREIAGLLGGEIAVESSVGRGSTFTLYHPAQRNQQRQDTFEATPPPLRLARSAAALAETRVDDDRTAIDPDDRVLLVIEDDPTFANLLLGFAHDRGFKALVAHSGRDALDLAEKYVPDAITLDVGLPDTDGWNVLESLKASSSTANIPVHVISGDDHPQRALQAGAVAHLQKPVSEEALVETFDRLLGFAESGSKNVLVVEDDLTQLNAMVNLISTGEMRVTAVSTAEAALDALSTAPFDCIVVDLSLPDMTGERLIELVRHDPATQGIPVIVYTARDVTRDEEARLRKLSSTIIVKDGLAPDRLLHELKFFLHRVEADLATRRPGGNGELSPLVNRCVLIVDDDVRNIYALEAALQSYGMDVVSAESGAGGIEALTSRDDIDIVLMDIMMPEMDGYETIRRIRANQRISSIPIIALTAKAMKGDRDACIAAGASEYVSKPVDIDQLASLLKIWLTK